MGLFNKGLDFINQDDNQILNEAIKLLDQEYLSPSEYQKAKKLKKFIKGNWCWIEQKQLYKKCVNTDDLGSDSGHEGI
jgi:hypothetical protein